MTRQLCIHWRARHVTDCRLRKLREALAAHPGGDEVRLQLRRGDVFRLPVTVDAASSGLVRDVARATSGTGMSHVAGLEEPLR